MPSNPAWCGRLSSRHVVDQVTWRCGTEHPIMAQHTHHTQRGGCNGAQTNARPPPPLLRPLQAALPMLAEPPACCTASPAQLLPRAAPIYQMATLGMTALNTVLWVASEGLQRGRTRGKGRFNACAATLHYATAMVSRTTRGSHSQAFRSKVGRPISKVGPMQPLLS